MTEKKPDLSSLTINRTANSAPPNRGWLKGTLLVLAFLGLGYFGVTWYNGSVYAAKEVEFAVATMSSSSQENAVLTASGYVVAQRKAAVSSKVVGRLVELNVTEGQTIQSGAIIGRLESADIRAQREQTEANVALARADVVNAQAELSDAKREYDRLLIIAEQGAATQQQRDQAEARMRKAEAMLKSRAAAVVIQTAAIKSVDVQLENTIIRAPFNGTVLSKNANVGEVLTAMGSAAGSRGALVTLADMNSLEVEADVSESKIQNIVPNQPCEIRLNAYSDIAYKGFVHAIVPTADRSKATVQVKVRFVDKDNRVIPEMAAKVLFLKPESVANSVRPEPMLMLPVSAFTERGGERVIYVVVDGKAQKTSVKTGAINGGFIQVVSGLSAGARVILNPSVDINNGTPVVAKK